MRIFLIIAILFTSIASSASTLDCQNLYVGRIWINKGHGLYAVVYLNDPGNTSGSYWSYFTGWTDTEKNAALATLMYAKAAKHPVSVETENPNGCGLQESGTVTKTLRLATNP